MKRENQGRLYTKDNYENLVWVRRMVDNPNIIFITNILEHITGDITPINKYKLNLCTHEIENLGQELMQDVEEEALSFLDFTHHPEGDASDIGINDYMVILLKLSCAGGFYLWLDIKNRMRIFGIDDNGTIRFGHSVLDKQSMDMFIDEDKLFKFTVCKR